MTRTPTACSGDDRREEGSGSRLGAAGVGVVSGGSRVFMTQNFLTLRSGAARPVPAQFRLAGATNGPILLSPTGELDRDAAEVARRLPDRPGRAFIATVRDYPDALAGGGLAGVTRAPVVLTASDALPDQTRRWLGDRSSDIGQIYLLGGSAAVGGDVENQIRNAVR